MDLRSSTRVFFFKQKTAYELRNSDWSSDVCSSDLSASRSIRACAACFIPSSLATRMPDSFSCSPAVNAPLACLASVVRWWIKRPAAQASTLAKGTGISALRVNEPPSTSMPTKNDIKYQTDSQVSTHTSGSDVQTSQ